MRERAAAPPFYDVAQRGDVTAAERVFAHCRTVVDASRARRTFAAHARYAAAAAVSTRDVVESVSWFRPDVVVIDLPFDHLGALELAGQLRAARERDGGKPRLVALTKHAHEHRLVRTPA